MARVRIKKIPKANNGRELPSFEEWYKTVPKEKNYQGDYDLRTAYNELPYEMMNQFATSQGHLPDTYKLPNHSSFSNESLWYDGQTPGVGGYWNEDTFTPNPKIGPPVPPMDYGGMIKAKYAPGGILAQYAAHPVGAPNRYPTADGVVVQQPRVAPTKQDPKDTEYRNYKMQELQRKRAAALEERKAAVRSQPVEERFMNVMAHPFTSLDYSMQGEPTPTTLTHTSPADIVAYPWNIAAQATDAVHGTENIVPDIRNKNYWGAATDVLGMANMLPYVGPTIRGAKGMAKAASPVINSVADAAIGRAAYTADNLLTRVGTPGEAGELFSAVRQRMGKPTPLSINSPQVQSEIDAARTAGEFYYKELMLNSNPSEADVARLMKLAAPLSEAQFSNVMSRSRPEIEQMAAMRRGNQIDLTSLGNTEYVPGTYNPTEGLVPPPSHFPEEINLSEIFGEQRPMMERVMEARHSIPGARNLEYTDEQLAARLSQLDDGPVYLDEISGEIVNVANRRAHQDAYWQRWEQQMAEQEAAAVAAATPTATQLDAQEAARMWEQNADIIVTANPPSPLRSQQEFLNLYGDPVEFTAPPPDPNALFPEQGVVDVSGLFDPSRLQSYNTANQQLFNQYRNTPTPSLIKKLTNRVNQRIPETPMPIEAQPLSGDMGSVSGRSSSRAKFVKSYATVRDAPKGSIFTPTNESMSTDSYPYILRLVEKGVDRGIADVSYHGMQELNTLGFAGKVAKTEHVMNEINQTIKKINATSKTKLPYATPGGLVPRYSIQRKEFGGDINPNNMKYKIKSLPKAQYGMQMPEPLPEAQHGAHMSREAKRRQAAMNKPLWNVVSRSLRAVASEYNLDYEALERQLLEENGGLDPRKSSDGKHHGLPQFGSEAMQDYGMTRKILRSSKPEDVEKSIDAMGRYMRDLKQRYRGNQMEAALAYNWGMGNLDDFRAGRIKRMPGETRNYGRHIFYVDPVDRTPLNESSYAVNNARKYGANASAQAMAQEPVAASQEGEPTMLPEVVKTAPRNIAPVDSSMRALQTNLATRLAPQPVAVPTPDPIPRDTQAIVDVPRGTFSTLPSTPRTTPVPQPLPLERVPPTPRAAPQLDKSGTYPVGSFKRNNVQPIPYGDPLAQQPAQVAASEQAPSAPLSLSNDLLFPSQLPESGIVAGVNSGLPTAESEMAERERRAQLVGGLPSTSAKYMNNSNAARPQRPTYGSAADKNKVKLRDLMGELYALGDTPDYVQGQHFDPQLMQAYQISLQDRLNQANSTFKAVASRLTNPDSLAALAAQKYEADNAILGEQFRINQAQTNQVNNQNTEILNQAGLQNIQLADTQYQRQAQAKANTQNRKQAALTSIGNKYSQRDSENAQLKLYEQMFNYRQDEKGDFQYTGSPFNVNPTNYLQQSQFAKKKKRTDKYGDDSYSQDVLTSLEEFLAEKKAQASATEGLFESGGIIGKKWGGAIKRMK